MRADPGRRNDVVIHCQGVFDAMAAQLVRATVARAAPEARLRIDLSRAQEIDDAAIAALFRAVADRAPGRVTLRGLRQHQLRLLRYLGYDEGERDSRDGGERG